MAKNVLVVDEAGNRCEPTYPRRAAGLVKQGRAYWVGPEILCIRRPPRQTEGKTMAKGIYIQDVLARIDRVMEDTSYLHNAFSTIEKLPDRADSEAESTQARAEAVCEIVRAREKTNRRMLRLLERMLENQSDDAMLETDTAPGEDDDEDE